MSNRAELRARGERGSILGIACLLIMVVVGISAGLADLFAVQLVGERAISAADAAAHAALVQLNTQADAESLSIDVQAVKTACIWDITAGSNDPDQRCEAGRKAAQQEASRNGGVLQTYALAPDRHQVTATSRAVGFEVLVLVAVPRNLPFWPAQCSTGTPPPRDRGDPCWSLAAGAAKEAA